MNIELQSYKIRQKQQDKRRKAKALKMISGQPSIRH